MLVLISIGSLFIAGCSAPIAEEEAHSGAANELLLDLTAPAIIAHRGGPMLNPEESIEAYKAAAEAGFPLEMDIRPLGDGTLVPSHDRTVDRTMIGASGKLTTLTRDEWDSLQIMGVGDGEPGTSTTWAELLHVFGGKQLLVPQIDEHGELLEVFIKSIKDRNLEEATIVQSWSLDTSITVVNARLHALQLTQGKQLIAPEKLAAAGIEYVGVPKSVEKGYVESMQRKGIRVWVYTVNTVAEANTQIEKGADGIFTDDPWLMSEISAK